MPKHTHEFAEKYDGAGAFGLDRKTDEETIRFYLQKFSDDALMEYILPLLEEKELNEIYDLITKLLKKHLTEPLYHSLFLKDD